MIQYACPRSRQNSSIFALKISWYRSFPQLKSKKERLQRNNAIWVFEFLLSVLCLRNQAGLLSHPHAPSDAGNTLWSKGVINLSWNWPASDWVKWKNSFWPSWVSWFSCGLRILSCREGNWNQRLAVLRDDPNPRTVLEMGGGRETCQSAPPPNWSEKQDNEELDFWVPKMSFFIHEAQTIPHKNQTFPFRNWNLCFSPKQVYPTPQYLCSATDLKQHLEIDKYLEIGAGRLFFISWGRGF